MKKKMLSLASALILFLSLLPHPPAYAADGGSLYRPNPMCGEYLGENAVGLYEFNITIPDDRENQPTPLLPGPFHSSHEITNTGASAGSTRQVIATRAQYFYGCNPGTADITYSAAKDPGDPQKPVAVVHVTVLSQEDYDTYMSSASTPTAQDHTHYWRYRWSNPDCKSDGKFTRECAYCRTSETLNTASALGHRYTESVTRQPTAQWEGIRQYECMDCRHKYTESIPKLDTDAAAQPDAVPPEDGPQAGSCTGGAHLWPEEPAVTLPATCLREGEAVSTCQLCGQTRAVRLPKTAHAFGETQTEPATAGKEGRTYRTCASCGQEELISVLPKLKPAEQETPSNGTCAAGSPDMPRLSKQEIIDLLAANPASFSGEVFDFQPSCSAPYAAGKLSDAALQAALDRLNALRRIAGMPAARLDKDWCESSQYGAVILGRLGTLSHTPERPSDMDKSFYDKAYSATHSSNLYAGRTLFTAVDGWMDDSDASNVDRLGHRRWQLSPALNKVGFGYVENGSGYGRFSDEKVFERGSRSSSSVSYDSYGWPSAGYFPNDIGGFTASTAWSVTLNPSLYNAPKASDITVTLTRDSDQKVWTFSGRDSYAPSGSGAYFNINHDSYGVDNCIIFRPDGVTKYEGIYTVEIQGLKSKKGGPVPFTYQVEFFSTAQAPDPDPGAVEKPTAPIGTTPSGGGNPFTDVPSGAYYTDAVLWAYQNNVTAGTTPTAFSPYSACTRGQVVTFLWRAQGEPEPETAVNPFRDVKASDYYYKAVLWAYENGVTSGTSPAAFSPDTTCTNGHVVTFLWRASGEPLAGYSRLAGQFPYDYYTPAVAWADATGLLEDTGAAFDPGNMSPRANIVTYLYRSAGKLPEGSPTSPTTAV